METIIKVRVDGKGHACGTVGWFKDFLANSELIIKYENSESPEMFLRNKDEKWNYFVCKVNHHDDDEYYDIIDGYACTYPIKDYYENSSNSGLFNFSLTPACHKVVQEMILAAKDIFAEWWENDGNSIE